MATIQYTRNRFNKPSEISESQFNDLKLIFDVNPNFDLNPNTNE
jgi:hypothetical protein